MINLLSGGIKFMSLKAKDLAELLGISPATVSLVLNNKPGISEATREKVINKIHELGYSNLLNRITSNGKNIGFIIYKRHGHIISESPFFSLIIESIDNTAKKYGYNLMVMHVDKTKFIEQDLERIKNSECEGLIIFATEMLKEDLEFFKDIQIPFILLDNCIIDEPIDSVSINNAYGTLEAVKHFVTNGHRKIGYLQSKIFINSFDERKRGFFSALNRFGIQTSEKYIFEVGYPEEMAYQDFKEILNNTKDIPTALFADNDLIAYGTIRALKEFGYRVPEDVSIIGFDDRPICLFVEPKLTTVNVPKDLFGSTVVETLISRLESISLGKELESFIRTEIGTQLIERDSVAKI